MKLAVRFFLVGDKVVDPNTKDIRKITFIEMDTRTNVWRLWCEDGTKIDVTGSDTYLEKVYQ